VTERTPTVADAETLAALLNRIADGDGAGWVDAGELRLWMTSPALRPEDFHLFEVDGRPAAYADVYVPAGQTEKAWADVRVLPERRGSEVEAAALAWGEQRSAERGARRVLTQIAPNPAAEATLTARGYRRVRHSFTMEIDLVEEPPEPDWPEGIAVLPFRPGEEEAVHAAADEAFADHWEHTPAPFDEWLHHMTTREGYDPTLWFVAREGEEVAAVCLCRARHENGVERGWCDTLAVRRPWRRRGLGSALLRHAFRELRSRGFVRAGLGVDGENTTGAVRLYERGGMHVARRWDTWERSLG
jgi:ribosomal protein S18 acetylase RimI-like enzyme